VNEIDTRAKKILFDVCHWRQPRSRSDADIAYAKSKHYMFDPITADHDEVVAGAQKVVRSLELADVSGAFLASLSLRRLDLRSGIVSYVRASTLKTHVRSVERSCDEPDCADCNAKINDPEARCETCNGCGEYPEADLNALSYDRHRFGFESHADPMYCFHDLTQLARELPVSPTSADLEIFETILAAIDNAPKTETPTKLSKRLAGIVSPKADRDRLLEALGVIGVLVAKKQRRGPSTDWFFIEDWRGEDGYNRGAVKRLFGMHRKRRRRSS
jgi:hypothetical protein